MTAKKAKSRQKIMHAAKVLFEQNGIDAVSFQQIADAADVCRTTVFNHFAGTRELMLAIFTQEIDDLTAYCDESGLRGQDKVLALFDKLIADTANYPTLATQLIHNAILCKEPDNPIAAIEQVACHALGEDKDLAIIAMGIYLGLISHCHIHRLPFKTKALQNEFRRLFARCRG